MQVLLSHVKQFIMLIVELLTCAVRSRMVSDTSAGDLNMAPIKAEITTFNACTYSVKVHKFLLQSELQYENFHIVLSKKF